MCRKKRGHSYAAAAKQPSSSFIDLSTSNSFGDVTETNSSLHMSSVQRLFLFIQLYIERVFYQKYT